MCNIKNKEQLEININYDSNLINFKIIKLEILMFLGLLKCPSILAFNKHSQIKTNKYRIVRNNFCCEYCLKGAIEDLYEIEGIEKVNLEKFTINIEYNPKLTYKF